MAIRPDGWRTIEIGLSDDARSLGSVSMWMKEFDTTADPESWRSFLYEPLSQLREAEIIKGDGWRVVTLIINHHKPLNPRIGLASVTLNEDEKDVGITIYKLEE